MLTRSKEPSSRSHSIASSSLMAEDNAYDNIDQSRLYEAVLKIAILEYCNEARFWTPIVESPKPQLTNGTNNGSSANSKTLKASKQADSSDPKLPTYLLSSLENRLNLIAMKKSGSNLDDMTRRSLLRLYSELLDPKFKADVASVNKPEYLVMKFVSCANKELLKIGTIPSNEISSEVFKQAGKFVQILISLIQKDKNSDAIIAKLEKHKESLKPISKVKLNHVGDGSVSSQLDSSAKYPQPSFRITDMDKGCISLISELFAVDQVKLQQDIFKYKDLSQPKALHKDINQILFYLDKDLGQYTSKSFTSEVAYHEWKARERHGCEQLMAKYQIPSSMKLLPVPALPSGDDFYVFPTSSSTKPFFVILAKLCLEYENRVNTSEFSSEEKPFFSKQSQYLMGICARFWRIDYPTRAVSLYTAAHLSGILKDPLYDQGSIKELGPIDLNMTTKMFFACKRVVEEQGKLDWEDKHKWSLKDQDGWVKNLSYSYNETLFGIKESLVQIFNKTVKPKFGPYLGFLGEFLESDTLFQSVEQMGLPRRWEKKLSKALLRTSEIRYAELLSNLPRDNTLDIVHILDISDSIVSDIKMLQKRYKSPLLGFLNVSRTVGAVISGMFAADAKNILKHIDTYAKNKHQVLPYGDILEAYKSLYEIRDIHNQVSTPGSLFKFNLEDFFFPFLEAWIDESGEKISNIIHQAISSDKLEPIDLSKDDKKYSSSVLDIFTLIKEFLKILNSLNWSNEFQLAKMYTSLLKSISDGVLFYANSMADKIVRDLDEEEQERLALEAKNETLERRKSGNWFDEVKNVVSNMQNNTSKLLASESYNFKPELCVALNNLDAMMQQLTKLEDILDPEMISNTVAAFDPTLQKNYTSHIFSLRIIKAENLKSATSSSSVRPYITMIDTKVRKTIGKTRTISNNCNPEWDEEFELTLPANSSLTISVTVWDEKFGTHSICGRALLQLDPRRFKHDGIPQEVYLDLDSQGRVLVEVAVESERVDAIFVMGRAHRCLKRCEERCIKLIVEKFSRFIHYCFSRNNLKSICGNNGNIKPTQEQIDNAMMPLYNYLNMNLQVLAEFLSNHLLMKVMLATWTVVVASADELLLPKLASATTFHLSNIGSKLKSSNTANANSGWQSAVSSAMANVTNSIGISGFGKLLTNTELETVFSWLHFLCFDFFHNDGNGPPLKDLKNEQYQALLLIPVYYDGDINYLTLEVERLSPAYVMMLRDRNNFGEATPADKTKSVQRSMSRAGTIVRNKTILANATAKARAKADKEAQEAKSDPIAAQTLTEDIILRLLLIKDEKAFVARRLEQREKMAHSIATERLAKAAAEGRFSRP